MKSTLEKVMIGILIFLILLFIFVIIFVIANKKDNNNVVENSNLEVSNYINIEDVNNDLFKDIYKEVNLKKLSFKNLKTETTNDFTMKQDEIIKNISDNIETNKEFIDDYNTSHNVVGYTNSSKIDSTVISSINENTLSILYLVENSIDYKNIENNIINLFVDIVSKDLLDTSAVLNKYNLSKEGISKQITTLVIESNSNKEELLKDIDNYSKKLMDNFDKYIYVYFNNDGIYLKYNKTDISNYLFNSKLDSVKYSTFKIKGF